MKKNTTKLFFADLCGTSMSLTAQTCVALCGYMAAADTTLPFELCMPSHVQRDKYKECTGTMPLSMFY